jgi:hypothetical protein
LVWKHNRGQPDGGGHGEHRNLLRKILRNGQGRQLGEMGEISNFKYGNAETLKLRKQKIEKERR